MAIEALNRLKAAGAHIVGATLTKSTAESSAYGYGYGYGSQRYGALNKNRTEIVMIPNQADAEA